MGRGEDDRLAERGEFDRHDRWVGGENLTAMTDGGERRVGPLAGWVKDNRWVERGEFDRQQDGWRMTAGWGGMWLAANRGGDWRV